MAIEKINATDTLNLGREKINQAIDAIEAGVQIGDSDVTTNKIASKAVTLDKIGDDAINIFASTELDTFQPASNLNATKLITGLKYFTDESVDYDRMISQLTIRFANNQPVTVSIVRLVSDTQVNVLTSNRFTSPNMQQTFDVSILVPANCFIAVGGSLLYEDSASQNLLYEVNDSGSSVETGIKPVSKTTMRLVFSIKTTTKRFGSFTDLKEVIEQVDKKTSLSKSTLIPYDLDATNGTDSSKYFIYNRVFKAGTVVRKLNYFAKADGPIFFAVAVMNADDTITIVDTITFMVKQGLGSIDVNYRLMQDSFITATGQLNYSVRMSGAANYLEVSRTSSEVRKAYTKNVASYYFSVQFEIETSEMKKDDYITLTNDLFTTVETNDFVNKKNDWITNATNQSSLAANQYNIYANRMQFDYQKMTVNVTVTANSKAGLFTYSSDQQASYYELDAENNKINIYGTVATTVASNVIASADLNVVPGRKYQLQSIKENWSITFRVVDTVTLEETILTYQNDISPTNGRTGLDRGEPGILCTQGSATFGNFSLKHVLFPNPEALIIGDSITEGLGLGTNVSLTNRYSAQLRDKYYDGNCVISGSMGETSAQLLDRLNAFFRMGYRPKNVIVTIGTNDRNNYQDWEKNIKMIYKLIAENGATPIISCPPIPLNGIEGVIKMRNFILTQKWKTIRFDLATSLNRDGSTHDSSNFTDGIHPNVSGSNKMYRQATVDLDNF